eukprot:CAMPEP_0119312600 /NCGR_PEP_ID=MMETSP1333-20130426/26906_1 /TAXON_ID=418940 /ORGANISM="Scyphosphaera apsteinii, Strain RCC1455" /LENGTH=251 /DNA_ID=CAMNT_0007317249 /DNA_START=42 /DNA_END=797 /DNA_ORIENTATION=-
MASTSPQNGSPAKRPRTEKQSMADGGTTEGTSEENKTVMLAKTLVLTNDVVNSIDSVQNHAQEFVMHAVRMLQENPHQKETIMASAEGEISMMGSDHSNQQDLEDQLEAVACGSMQAWLAFLHVSEQSLVDKKSAVKATATALKQLSDSWSEQNKADERFNEDLARTQLAETLSQRIKGVVNVTKGAAVEMANLQDRLQKTEGHLEATIDQNVALEEKAAKQDRVAQERERLLRQLMKTFEDDDEDYETAD